jgi:hypothetical protein
MASSGQFAVASCESTSVLGATTVTALTQCAYSAVSTRIVHGNVSYYGEERRRKLHVCINVCSYVSMSSGIAHV